MPDSSRHHARRQHRLRSRCVTGLLRLLGRLPLNVNRGFGAALGRLSWFVGAEAKTISLDNIARCLPQLSAPEQRELAKASVIHTAVTATEVASIWAADYETFKTHIRQIHNRELIEATHPRGLILLAPHLGNWEVFGLVMPGFGETTFMYQPTEMAELDQLMRQARSKEGVKLAPTNPQGVGQVLRALRAGEIVGILPDQVPDYHSGRPAPFFGHPALTMTLAHKLIQRTGCDVVMGYAKRIKNGFDIVFEAADPAIHSADPDESIAALNRSVEICVRAAPEQYQWEYKRFKRIDKVLAQSVKP